MNWKQTVCDFLECEKEEKQEIARLNEQKTLLEKQLLDSSTLITNALKQRDESLLREQNALNSLNLCQEAYENPTNVSEKPIKYLRHTWFGPSIGWKQENISVRMFITVNDEEIIREVINNKLVITDTSKFDEIVPKIYAYFKKKYYSYGSDDQHLGFDEYWNFPYEVIKGRKYGVKFDCEDYAHLLVTAFRIAGVPANKVFVSWGEIRLAPALHSTVYVEDSEGTWRHLNSTNWNTRANLQDYPDKDDETDGIGIKKNGFVASFNDKLAISSIEDEETKKLYEELLADIMVIE